MAENIREIALDTLLVLERGEDFSHRLLRAVLDKYNYLEERDKAFIKRVTEGTVERRIELDYYLDSFSRIPVKKMKPLIRCLLRMSVYQLLYMDAVPDRAVCNEACKLVQKRRFGSLVGFVNGILRNIAREREHLPFPDRDSEPDRYLSIKYSMPVWIVTMWTEHYGRETTEKILAGLMEIRPVSLRFRTDLEESEREAVLRDLETAGVGLRPSGLLPYVYLADNTEDLTELPGFASGKYMVQDASSALAVEAAGIRRGNFVMDVCAAPGGKSILAAEKTGPRGRVLSRDVSEEKVLLIEENADRMGAENLAAEIWDAVRVDGDLLERADVVLADVPCSGLGVTGRKNDIKYNVTPEKIEALTELQRKIIKGCWRYVKPGGKLLYSTCTIDPAENGQMVEWIQENFPFVLEEQRQLMPGIDGTDGFYFARLRRTG